MKQLCSCNCADPRARYITPWCSLLHRDDSFNILHLWYKLEWLRKEVEKRSSYLGKFRRTEESKHLLDLIAMTEDEKDLFMPFAKDAMADVFDALQRCVPKSEKTCFWREGQETITFTDNPLPSPAVAFYKGDYVMYNNDLYMAIEDGTSDDFDGKLVPTEDYRESIHYGLMWTCQSNINMADPLDTAIFEALVAHIIYHWLLMSYPDEAAVYRMQYEEHLEKIRKRASFLENQPIVRRIPRIL